MSARERLMRLRYAPGPRPFMPRRRAMIWIESGGRMRVLVGQESLHRTRMGRLYNLRLRLARRFGFTAFDRR